MIDQNEKLKEEYQSKMEVNKLEINSKVEEYKRVSEEKMKACNLKIQEYE